VSRRSGRACRRDQRRRCYAQVRACRVQAHARPRAEPELRLVNIRTFVRQRRAVYSDICSVRPGAGEVRPRRVWNEQWLRESSVGLMRASEGASGDSFESFVRAAECGVPDPCLPSRVKYKVQCPTMMVDQVPDLGRV
jgi:hypothetical protein